VSARANQSSRILRAPGWEGLGATYENRTASPARRGRPSLLNRVETWLGLVTRDCFMTTFDSTTETPGPFDGPIAIRADEFMLHLFR